MKFIDRKEPNEIANFDKSERNKILKELRESGLSIRQIERATGISRGVIGRGDKIVPCLPFVSNLVEI